MAGHPVFVNVGEKQSTKEKKSVLPILQEEGRDSSIPCRPEADPFSMIGGGGGGGEVTSSFKDGGCKSDQSRRVRFGTQK